MKLTHIYVYREGHTSYQYVDEYILYHMSIYHITIDEEYSGVPTNFGSSYNKRNS